MSASRYNYLKKITRRLQDEIVDIEETKEVSDYFSLTGLDQVYGLGIHKLYVAGSPFLKKGTFIYVSIQDSAGRDLVINVPSSNELYEQRFNPIARFTFTVDEGLPNLYNQTIQEVADGMATMIMVGTTTTGQKVRWTKRFAISKAIQNQPIIDRGEWISGEFYNIGDVVLYQGIFYKTILDHEAIPSILPTNLTYWRRMGSDSGVSTALLVLSNDSHNVHFSYDLVGDYTGAYTSASVFRGEEDVSSEWAIEIESIEGNINGTLSPMTLIGSKVYTVTSMDAGGVGVVNFKAYRANWDQWEEGLVYQDTNLVQFVDTTILNTSAPDGFYIPVGASETWLTGSFFEYGIQTSSGLSLEWFVNGSNQGVYDAEIEITTAMVPSSASVTFSASIAGRQYEFETMVVNLNDSGIHAIVRNPDGRNIFLSPDTGSVFLTASLYDNTVLRSGITSYQWYADGVELIGETSETLEVTSTMVNNSASFYAVILSNSVEYTTHPYHLYDIDQEFPVDIQNSIWECVTSHTSTELNRPNTDAGFWIPRTNIGILRKSFSVNSTTDGIDNPVLIISSADGDTFKNDLGQQITLTASIVAGGTVQDVSLNTFTWTNNGSTLTGETAQFLQIGVPDLSGSDLRVFSATTTFNGESFTGYFTVKRVSDGVSFFVDSDNGYVIRNDLGSVTLQIKFNVGGVDRRADLTGIDWYKDGVSLGSSSLSLVVTADDVDEKVVYLASASFGGSNYESSRDVIDITDFVYVDILSDTEGYIYKDAYSPDKTLTAILEKDGTQAPTASIDYYWKINGVSTASTSDSFITLTADQVIESASVSVTQSFEGIDYYKEVVLLDNTRAGTNLYIEGAQGFTIKNKDTEIALTASLRMYGQNVDEGDISDYEWYKNGVYTSSGKYIILDASGVDNVDTFQARADFRGYTYRSQETNVNDVLDGVMFYISSDNGVTIKNSDGQLNLTARLYWGNKEYDADSYEWSRKNDDEVSFSPYGGNTKSILVTESDVTNKATFKVSGSYLGEVFEATINIIDVTDGINLILTNEQAVLNFNTAGVTDYTDAFSTASVFRGTTNVTSDWVLSTGSPEFAVGGATFDFNPATGIIQVTSASVPSLGFIPIVATKGSTVLTKNYQVITTQDGFTSYKVDLISDFYNIKYNALSTLIEPTSSFNLVATPTNVPSPYYKFFRRYDSGTFVEVYAGASNTYVVDPAIFPSFTASVTYRVDVHNVDGLSPVYAQDALSIYKTFDGLDGEQGYSVSISNENHSVYCDSSGTPKAGELGETGFAVTEIGAFRGGDELDMLFGGTPTLGQFRVTASANGCTINSSSINGGLTAKYWVTAMSQNSATVTFTMLLENISTFTKTWKLTKQLDPQPPVDGVDGDDGANGGGIVYRGIWDSSKNYYYFAGVRVDAVFHNGSYWFASQSSLNQIPSTSSSFWAGAGGAFEMTATKILLAEDATITKTLVMGTSDGVNSGAGIIRSTGASSITDGNGYFLSASGDVRIGTATSGDNFIRWNSGASQIQIRSTNFALTGSGVAIGTGKVAVGASAVSDTVGSTTAGVVMDSSGYFKAYNDANNYIRLNNTGMELKASKLDIRAGSGSLGNYVGISSTDSTYVMWVSASAASTAPFWIKRNGDVYVQNLSASGNISARRISLNNIQGDFWDGDGFQLGGINGIYYSGGNVNIGTNVSIQGSLTASAFRVDDDNEWDSSGFILGGADGITYTSGSVNIGSDTTISGNITAKSLLLDGGFGSDFAIVSGASLVVRDGGGIEVRNGNLYVGSLSTGVMYFVSGTLYMGVTGGAKWQVNGTNGDQFGEGRITYEAGTFSTSLTASAIRSSGEIWGSTVVGEGLQMTAGSPVAGALVVANSNTGELVFDTNITVDFSGVITATDFAMSSDFRLKENIEPIKYGLKEVMNLKPVQYNFKHQTEDHRRIGFIAQEMEAIIPEVVGVNKFGKKGIEEHKTISYPVLVSLLTKAIQEQQEQIEELKRKLN